MRVGQRQKRHVRVWWILFLTLIAFYIIPQRVRSEKTEGFSLSDNYYIPENSNSNKELIVKPEYPVAETVYEQIDNFITQNGMARMDDFQITNLVLASDIEGNLNAVNRKTGELLWSLVGGQPLVSIRSDADTSDAGHTTPVASSSHPTDTSTREYRRYSNADMFESSHTKSSGYDSRRHTQNHKKQDVTWLVEPYGEGTVYHFMGDEGLEKLPISIKQFVLNSPFSIDDQFVYTGSRISGIVKINARTGAIVESYGLDGVGTCPSTDLDDAPGNLNTQYNYDDNDYGDGDDISYNFEKQTDYFGSHSHDSEDNEAGPFIKLGKTIYDLTIHSKNNTSWNITYVQWGPNNLHANLVTENTNSADDTYIQPFHDSSLLALDVSSKSIKWVSNLPYVTVNIFDVFANSLVDNDYVVLPHPLDYGSSSMPKDKEESTYLDRTKEGSWYALSERHYPSLVRSAPIAKYITNERWRLPPIFQNDDLLEISISGVHDNSLRKHLKDDSQRNINKHLAVYQSATAMSIPEKNNGLTYSPGQSKKVTRSNRNHEIDEDIFDENVLRAPTLTFKSSSISKLVYRAVENVFVAMICLGIFYVMSKFGLLKAFINNSKAKDSSRPVKMVTIETDPTVDQKGKFEKKETTTLESSDLRRIVSKEDSDDTIRNTENNEKENNEDKDETEESARRKRKRGCRGGKKNRKKESIDNTGVSTAITSSSTDDDDSGAGIASVKTLEAMDESLSKITNISNSLSITEHILGFGSHGTIVFKGFFENRPVAVKRMLLDFYDVASHEINLLQESDDHSNVIRYFCSQEKNKFLYIALELCSSSLEDLVEKKKENLDVTVETSEILYQIANGVNHLHSLKIVHRDIKPQNILVALSKNNKNKNPVRFLISDFGLCKKLDADQSSFKGTTANAAGTSGWRAPELLLDTSPAYVDSSLANRVRLTRSVDVFSAGCVFFYVLTGGYHPFGDRYIREGNIIKGEYDLSKLNTLPDAYTIKDLISSMIHKNPMARPDIGVVMKHPYFWSVEKKLEFLLKVSDRFEVERRDPPSDLLLKLESIASDVLGPKGWFDKFDAKFIDNLGKYRKYNTHKLMDLLRAIRNKYHHYQDLPKDLAMEIGSLPDGFYWYFSGKFPRMLLLVYRLMKTILHDDELLAQFFQ